VYYSHCNAGGAADPCERNPFDVRLEGNREVVATFADNAINELVAGAAVEAGAVNIAGAGADTNAPDEEGVEQEFNEGDVLGPQLTGVDVEEDTTSFGDF